MLDGLSPRGRGNHYVFTANRRYAGSIPAWAGEPRARGQRGIGEGLSPRGRGNRLPADAERAPGRSIPAWAGEPPQHRYGCNYRGVYPRVGGGTSLFNHLPVRLSGLSPRGRGNPNIWNIKPTFYGSIPAWAGEPSPARHPRQYPRVYPRVGGGT